MDRERAAAVYRLFDKASDLALPQRETWLAAQDAPTDVIAEVRALLAMSDPTASHAPHISPLTEVAKQYRERSHAGAEVPLPATVGPYRVLSVLGQGGMGVVYLAQQTRPERMVALKVVRPGYTSAKHLKRFEYEAEVLGRLLHPGIAQIYEAGTADLGAGLQPFFAMEYVDGIPLTRYAQEHALDPRERLALFTRVCDAVEHAHQKGVIHRDLKPANILVTSDGQPKVLDFGVARTTDSDLQATMQTDIGQLVGTLPYMSPEQVSGKPEELDTRSDVYALGVILYELLAGRPPYSVENHLVLDAARIIREEEPTRLSSIDRALRGDIETIVGHALEKDPNRRYPTASALGADIGRFLGDQPISARPVSAWYQIERFSKRNRGLVIAATAGGVTLICGLIGTSIMLERAISAESSLTSQLSETDKARTSAELVAEFMSETLQGAGPSVALGRDVTMLKEMMDQAAARIENGDLTHAPEAELTLRGTVGSTYRELALYEEATRMLEPAVGMARSLHPNGHATVVVALSNAALLLHDRGDLQQAEEHYRESLRVTERLFPGDSIERANALSNLATVLQDQGELAAAESNSRESLEITQRLSRGDSLEVAIGLNNVASILQARGELKSAESFFRTALAMAKRLFPGDHPQVASGLNNLSVLLQEQGDLDGAEPLARESMEMFRRLYSSDSPEVAAGLNNLASLLKERHDLESATAMYREALAIMRRVYSRDHARVATGLQNLAFVLELQGQIGEAEALYNESLEMYRRLYSGDHADIADALNNLALLHHRDGDLQQAESLYRESLEMNKRLVEGDDGDVANVMGNLAALLQQRGDFAAAEFLSRESLDMQQRLVPGDSLDLSNGLNNLAALSQARGDVGAAESLYRQSLEMAKRLFPEGHTQTAIALTNLASLLSERGDVAGAEGLCREAFLMYASTLGIDHRDTAIARLDWGQCLSELGRFADAEAELIAAERDLSRDQGTAKEREECVQAIVTLYQSWEATEPGVSHSAELADWQARLESLSPVIEIPSEKRPTDK